LTDAVETPPPASTKDLRSFGFTFGAVAVVFALLLTWRGRTVSARGFALFAVSFFLVGALTPALLRPFHGPWMKFAEILGYINTRILLGLCFFVGVTPTGLLMRLAGKDPMSRSFKRKGDASYWTKAPPHADGVRHFDRQF
jgi:hypothetical protein